MLVLSVLSNLPKGQVELKVGQGKQKTHLLTGQVDLDFFFLPWGELRSYSRLKGLTDKQYFCGETIFFHKQTSKQTKYHEVKHPLHVLNYSVFISPLT